MMRNFKVKIKIIKVTMNSKSKNEEPVNEVIEIKCDKDLMNPKNYFWLCESIGLHSKFIYDFFKVRYCVNNYFTEIDNKICRVYKRCEYSYDLKVKTFKEAIVSIEDIEEIHERIDIKRKCVVYDEI